MDRGCEHVHMQWGFICPLSGKYAHMSKQGPENPIFVPRFTANIVIRMGLCCSHKQRWSCSRYSFHMKKSHNCCQIQQPTIVFFFLAPCWELRNRARHTTLQKHNSDLDGTIKPPLRFFMPEQETCQRRILLENSLLANNLCGGNLLIKYPFMYCMFWI